MENSRTRGERKATAWSFANCRDDDDGEPYIPGSSNGWRGDTDPEKFLGNPRVFQKLRKRGWGGGEGGDGDEDGEMEMEMEVEAGMVVEVKTREEKDGRATNRKTEEPGKKEGEREGERDADHVRRGTRGIPAGCAGEREKGTKPRS